MSEYMSYHAKTGFIHDSWEFSRYDFCLKKRSGFTLGRACTRIVL